MAARSKGSPAQRKFEKEWEELLRHHDDDHSDPLFGGVATTMMPASFDLRAGFFLAPFTLAGAIADHHQEEKNDAENGAAIWIRIFVASNDRFPFVPPSVHLLSRATATTPGAHVGWDLGPHLRSVRSWGPSTSFRAILAECAELLSPPGFGVQRLSATERRQRLLEDPSFHWERSCSRSEALAVVLLRDRFLQQLPEESFLRRFVAQVGPEKRENVDALADALEQQLFEQSLLRIQRLEKEQEEEERRAKAKRQEEEGEKEEELKKKQTRELNAGSGDEEEETWEIDWGSTFVVPPGSEACQSARCLLGAHEKGQVSANTIRDSVLKGAGTDQASAYARVCFQRMLENEVALGDEYCCFYHAYNTSALVYEVQSALLASALGGSDATSSSWAPPRPVPRLFCQPFDRVPDSKALRAFFRTQLANAKQDHDPAYREVGLSVTCSLFCAAPSTLHCFRVGYDSFDLDLDQILRDVLSRASHGLSLGSESLEEILQSVRDLGARFGFSVPGSDPQSFRNEQQRRAFQGHMLQIFVRKDVVDTVGYASQPLGVPIESAPSLRAHLELGHTGGTARLLVDPRWMANEDLVRTNHFCGNWRYLGGDPTLDGSRAQFHHLLAQALAPILARPDVVRHNIGLGSAMRSSGVLTKSATRT